MTAEEIPRLDVLSPLELASGAPLGLEHDRPLVGVEGADPLTALEGVLRPLLSGDRRCTIAFSGGRDSSALLAVADGLARREGLPRPRVLTARWPLAPESDETDWQESVIAHLGIEDWHIFTMDDEVDLLGRHAQDALRRHGLFWPPSAVMTVPFFEQAAGGMLLTGEGGDEIFGGRSRGRPLSLAIRDRKVRGLPHARRIIGGFSPHAVRTTVVTNRLVPVKPWLRSPYREQARRREGRAWASEPLSWGAYLRWVGRFRTAQMLVRTLKVLGNDADAQFHAPFWDTRFLAALAGDRGFTGYGGRTLAMRALFGEMLPPASISRSTKANMTGAFWSRASKSFVADWDGSGVDDEIVDAVALRDIWHSDTPYYHTAPLLHAAWLAANRPKAGTDAGTI